MADFRSSAVTSLRKTLGLAAVGLCMGARADAAVTTLRISESALNKFADAVGSVEGDAGIREISLTRPCGTTFCPPTVYREHLRWTMSNGRFRITANAVTFLANLETNYGCRRSSSRQIEAPVRMAYDSATGALAVSVESFSVAIKIPFPGFGYRLVATLDLDPEYDFSLAFSPFALRSGAGKSVNVLPASVEVVRKPGEVEVEVDLTLW